VFTQDGRLVASFVQDSMVRSFGDTQTARGSGILTM
jgi:acyl-CoA thioesterase